MSFFSGLLLSQEQKLFNACREGKTEEVRKLVESSPKMSYCQDQVCLVIVEEGVFVCFVVVEFS